MDSSHGSGRGFYAGASEQIVHVSIRWRWPRRSIKSARRWPFVGSRWPLFHAKTTSPEDSCLRCRWPSTRSSRTSICAERRSRVEPLRQPSTRSHQSSFCSMLVDLYILGLGSGWLQASLVVFHGIQEKQASRACQSYQGTMKGWNHGLHQTTTAHPELSSKEGGDVMCRKYCSVNSNRVQILGKIRLDWFVISLNLEIGFLRVKSAHLYKDGIVSLLRKEGRKNKQSKSLKYSSLPPRRLCPAIFLAMVILPIPQMS